MECTICGELTGYNDRSWAFDEPYCTECFEDRFDYCFSCDELVSRSETFIGNDDNSYCILKNMT